MNKKTLFIEKYAGQLSKHMKFAKKNFDAISLNYLYFFLFSPKKFGGLETVPYFPFFTAVEDGFREEWVVRLAEEFNERLKSIPGVNHVLFEPEAARWYIKNRDLDKRLFSITKKLLKVFDYPVLVKNVTGRGVYYHQDKLGTSPFDDFNKFREILKGKHFCLNVTDALNSIENNYIKFIKTFSSKLKAILVTDCTLEIVKETNWIYREGEVLGKGAVNWEHIIKLIDNNVGLEKVEYLFFNYIDSKKALESKKYWVNNFENRFAKLGLPK